MPTLKLCETFLQQINSAIKNYTFYPKGHPYVFQPIKRSFELMAEFFKEVDEIQVGIIEDIIWVQNIPVPQEFMWDLFRDVLKKIEKDAVVIRKGVDFEEWERFVVALATLSTGDEFKNDNFSLHIVFHTIEKEDKDIAKKIYNDAISAVKNVISDVRLGRIPKADEVKNVVNKIVDQVLKNKQTMLALTLIKSYDDYLFHHSVNVTILCLALGEALQLTPDLLRELGTAAMLHDIGKIKIDPRIVLKPDKLTDEEWEQMKQHPVTGYDTLRHMEGLSEVVYKVALEHHMKFNLTGYPEVGKDYKLHPASMILSICDCYDAMTTHRIYQRCHEPREALEFMTKMAGINFEPNYLKTFIKMLGIYPQGTLVKLNTGDTAIVTRPNPNSPDKPVVRVVFDVLGTKVEDVITYDLSTDPVDKETGMKIYIVGTVNPTWHDVNLSDYIIG